MDIKQLYEVANDLFGKKLSLNSLHQEIADNFYPERAEFTIRRSLGTDFAANLMTSYPVWCRRSLGNQFSTMLRPTAKPWFHVRRRFQDKDTDQTEVRQWLDWFEETQRRAMYDPLAMFTRATKEGDHDFAAFGQCVISVEMNRNADGMLYRAWHLRDCAWQEDEHGRVGFFARKWKAPAHVIKNTFRNVSPKIIDVAGKTPFEEFELMHIVCPAEMFDGDARGRPRFSLWYDAANAFTMEEQPIWGRHYVVPRWQTVSGSQYSYSPATVCALPDARLIQAMTYTLLEAGEKATSPPIVARKNILRSDVSLYAGGITWVDPDYDERTGEALKPLTQDFRGFEFGVNMNADTRSMIHNAFFLDALQMPERAPEMTAYEVGQRVQEYIRNALPIFEPIESEYNAAICEESFDLLLRHGAFGAPATWPRELRGAEVEFTFESPLHDQIEEQKAAKFQTAQQLIGAAIALDPAAAFVPKTVDALRDALMGIGVPPAWVNTQAYVEDAKTKQQQQMATQQKLAAMEQASNVAKNVGQSGMVPQGGAPAAPAIA